MSELPNGWTSQPLEAFAEVVRGASPRPKGDPRYFGGKIPWISIADVTASEGRTLYATRETVTEDGAKKSRLLPAGALILSNSGTVCVPKILAHSGCIHDGFLAISDFDEIALREYLYEYFEFIRPAVIHEYRQGMTQVNLNTGIVKAFTIPLPPLPEQHRIVAKIDSLSGKSKRARDHLAHVKILVNKYKQAILKAAFKGTLGTSGVQECDNEDAENHEMQAPWGIPPEWAWKRISDIGDVSLGRQRSPKDHVGPLMRPYVRAANITWTGWDLSDVKEMNFNDAEFMRFELKAGDVLVNEGSGSAKEVGKPAIWQGQISGCCFQNTLIRVRPKACTSEFLYWYFLYCALSQSFVPSTQGVNIYHIGKDGLARFPIPVPPLSNQPEIVQRIESAFAWIDRLASEATSAHKLIDHLDQAILSKAFLGELVPQDPNDEPASVLLERIKAERAVPKPVKGRRRSS